MRKAWVGNVLILLLCLAVPVLAMSACTPRGGRPGETEQGSFPTPENGGNAPAEKTPVPAQKETPRPSEAPIPQETAELQETAKPQDTSNPGEADPVAETDKPADTAGPSETAESPETGDPRVTEKPAATEAPSTKDPAPGPSDKTPDPATALPCNVPATKDPGGSKTPGSVGTVDPTKPTGKPAETGTAETPSPDPTPTPGGIVIDENGNIILPEIPIP